MIRYADANKELLNVGDVVKCWEDESNETGTITEFIEPDCDYDDRLERPVQYGPYVTVKWDVVGAEQFISNFYEGDLYYFDDIVKVADNE